MTAAPQASAPSRAGSSWIPRVAALLRRIIGAPDYATYVAHVARHHPDREPLGEREFLTERLNARYEKPGARCC